MTSPSSKIFIQQLDLAGKKQIARLNENRDGCVGKPRVVPQNHDRQINI